MLIAVTGARGQVGRAVVKELLEHGHRVRALMRTPWPECPEVCERVENLDLTDFDGVKQAIEGCDAVIHIANIPGPMDDNRPETFVNNITVNFNVMMACGLLGIDRVAFASSTCAGGYCRNYHYPAPPAFPLTEESPACPDDTYGISKLASELVAGRLCQRFPSLRVCSLRISWVTGESFYTEDAARLDREKPLRGYYGNLGTYVDERDAASAFRLAVEVPFDRVPAGAHVYYICHPQTRSPAPMTEFLAREFPGVPVREGTGPFDALESSQKAKRELGWEARNSWRQAVDSLSAAEGPRS